MRWTDKRGQFYLIAAFIIITVVVGFIAVSNYSTSRSFTRIYALKDELTIEAEKVLDYETLTGESVFEDFAANFSNYAGEDIQIYYIIGGLNSIEAYTYMESKKEIINSTDNGDKIIVTIDKADYKFDSLPGKNFYFIISQDIRGEKYIVIG